MYTLNLIHYDIMIAYIRTINIDNIDSHDDHYKSTSHPFYETVQYFYGASYFPVTKYIYFRESDSIELSS